MSASKSTYYILRDNRCFIYIGDNKGDPFKPFETPAIAGHTSVIQILLLYSSIISAGINLWVPLSLAALHFFVD